MKKLIIKVKSPIITWTLVVYINIWLQLKLIKMRAKLVNLNHCAVPSLSRAGTVLLSNLRTISIR